MPWKIRRFWHNAFDDILGNDERGGRARRDVGACSTASVGDVLRAEGGSLVLASVGQGRELRNLRDALRPRRQPAVQGGWCRAGTKPIKLGDLELTVVAPDEKNLATLQKDWDKKIKPILKKEKDKAAQAEAAAYVDKSVYNLSSIVVLVEADGKRMLLTGDGRGDYTLHGLRESRPARRKGKRSRSTCSSSRTTAAIRNVDQDYFEAIRADHYVISADGKFDNPDVETLEMISARPSRRQVHHPPDLSDRTSSTSRRSARRSRKFFAKEKAAGRKYRVKTRASGDLSFRIELA